MRPGVLNRRIRHGEIEIHVSEYFYGTTPAGEAEVAKALTDADNINIIGERAVAVAAGLGLIEPIRMPHDRRHPPCADYQGMIYCIRCFHIITKVEMERLFALFWGMI